MRIATRQSSSRPEDGDARQENEARAGLLRMGTTSEVMKSQSTNDGSTRTPAPTSGATGSKPTSVSDSLAAVMPGSFLTAADLQELARVYVVCLK